MGGRGDFLEAVHTEVKHIQQMTRCRKSECMMPLLKHQRANAMGEQRPREVTTPFYDVRSCDRCWFGVNFVMQHDNDLKRTSEERKNYLVKENKKSDCSH